ncbi:hypothetical protein [Larkinella soli]|uniref:hypothetical protein n=1 Tax=Larkinella soli TaxID=1770527 RepID=UPI000FFC4D63|nr:hypothetical protein [Larkinella soli]
MNTISKAGILLICVSLFYCCKTLQETPSPIIRLSSNVPPNAVANGKSSYRFVARVSESVSEEYSIVAFKCSGGIFANTDSANVQLVRVNEKGEGIVDWIVPAVGGSYFISATIGSGINTFSDQLQVTLQDSVAPVIPVVPDTIQISIPGTDTVRADGESLLKIDLALKYPVARQLVLANNAGTLSDGTNLGTVTETKPIVVQLDGAGRGQAFLRVGLLVEPYIIKAYVAENTPAFKLVQFTPRRANPDNIFLEADSSFVRPNSQTPLKAFLVRNVGKVSIGTRINYEAYQDIDGSKKTVDLLKNLANNLSDDKGTASAVFVADTTVVDRRRPVFIRASSRNDRGETIFKEIRIQVKEK